MRRVYYTTPKRRQVVQDALAQMRATSEALGPEFMARIKMLVKDFNPDDLWRAVAPAGQDGDDLAAPVPWDPAANHCAVPAGGEMEPVDQKKNLTIIMKFLELNPDNKSVQNQIRTLLQETRSLQ